MFGESHHIVESFMTQGEEGDLRVEAAGAGIGTMVAPQESEEAFWSLGLRAKGQVSVIKVVLHEREHIDADSLLCEHMCVRKIHKERKPIMW